MCLNLAGCETEDTGQARVRYQFGIWDASIKYWEFCDISNTILNLENSRDLLSIGYKTLGIHDRHVDSRKFCNFLDALFILLTCNSFIVKDVRIMVKVQIIQSEEEKHSLSQDLARVLATESDEYSDTIVECSSHNGEEPFKVNSLLIKARSEKLSSMLESHQDSQNPVRNFILFLLIFIYFKLIFRN